MKQTPNPSIERTLGPTGMRIPARLLASWTSQSSRSVAPASPQEVSAAFARLGARPTADVVSLYGQIGGMKIPDDNDWLLWSLDEFVEQNRQATNGPLAFSDYLLSCWNFHLEPRDAEVSRVLTDFGDGQLVEVAPSLQLFIEALDSSPLGVLDPLAPRR